MKFIKSFLLVANAVFQITIPAGAQRVSVPVLRPITDFSLPGNQQRSQRFVGKHLGVREAADIKDSADLLFQLFDSAGVLLWSEPYSYGVDDPAPEYLLTARGVVCKVRSDEGTVTFYDQKGRILARHDLVGNFSRTLQGRWSQDGSYFLATTPRKGVFLFDATGEILWEHKLHQVMFQVALISPESRSVLVGIIDTNSRKSQAIIFSRAQGPPPVAIIDHGLFDPVFLSNDKLLVGTRLTRGVPQQSIVLLYETGSGKQLFEVRLEKRIYSFKVLADNELIYVLHGDIKRLNVRDLDPKNRRAWEDTARLRDIDFIILNFKGEKVGEVKIPPLSPPPRWVTIHPASTDTLLVVQADDSLAAFKIGY